MKLENILPALLAGLLFPVFLLAQVPAGKLADKPLFRDPVYDGAADPVVAWNKGVKKWWMFYTNRRASATDAGGVAWVHGTRIGIAESADGGATWKYLDTANIQYHPDPGATFWAPEIMEHNGLYHMYLTYVPGIFNDWNHPRYILHLTSKDLKNWAFQSKVQLASDKVIDATVFSLPDGTWRMWYNNERDRKSIYYADSKDLYNWEDKGKAVGERGEGPKVFFWKDRYWMLVDTWAGMVFYSSLDLKNWQRQEEKILALPGRGAEDQAIGGHADVVVSGGRAYVFYFTHPGRRIDRPAPEGSFDAKRSLIQVGELRYDGTHITCDRDQPVYIKLGKAEINRRSKN
ncbi:family 43 glycosylhydrolase [Arcticibacter sp. MXS-1]|uniref:family 43 glycosylhydrolase n=1 Tax=Arcticibacter sp. MXS-1 TaxID=3341726 RepID=UPI0035A8FEA4